MTGNDKTRRRAPPAGAEQQLERKNAVLAYIELLNEHGEINVSKWLRKRLVLLAECTPTIGDENSALVNAGIVFAYVKERAPERQYTSDERLLVRVGTLFSDIGKTGPPGATLEQQVLVARMFAVERVKKPEELTVTQFFTKRLHKNWEKKWRYRLLPPLWQRKLKRMFCALKAGDPDSLTMREFYNLHTVWTLELLEHEESGIPRRAIPAAACHHRLRGDNPRDILNEDDTYAVPFEDEVLDENGNFLEIKRNERYDRPEKFVNLDDLYDAYRHREGYDHEEAMQVLTGIVAEGRGGVYAHDAEFQEILDDMANALRETA